ncbi:hypothetical protein D9M68_960860 [compost metagenome]
MPAPVKEGLSAADKRGFEGVAFIRPEDVDGDPVAHPDDGGTNVGEHGLHLRKGEAEAVEIGASEFLTNLLLVEDTRVGGQLHDVGLPLIHEIEFVAHDHLLD